jgi:hypothetical protein
MITGAHFLLYSKEEIAVHPASGSFVQRHATHELLGAVLYLMCDDLRSSIKSLAAKGVAVTEIEAAEWGLKTTIRLPSGGEIGLYQPAHPTALQSR